MMSGRLFKNQVQSGRSKRVKVNNHESGRIIQKLTEFQKVDGLESNWTVIKGKVDIPGR